MASESRRRNRSDFQHFLRIGAVVSEVLKRPVGRFAEQGATPEKRASVPDSFSAGIVGCSRERLLK